MKNSKISEKKFKKFRKITKNFPKKFKSRERKNRCRLQSTVREKSKFLGEKLQKIHNYDRIFNFF
jgi:hypothetical protein